MKRLKRAAILLSLAENLGSYGSWCGETHIQKSAYVLEELYDVDLELDFILYKHGPYCFELTDELSRLRGEGFLKMVPQYPYGPQLLPNAEGWSKLKKLYPKTLHRYGNAITAVAKWLGDKNVCDLERLATALMITKKMDPASDLEARAKELNQVKPHIDIGDARNAMMEVDKELTRSSG